MHTVLRTYRLDDGDIDEAMHRIDTMLADVLTHEPGFVAYEVVRTEADGITSVTTFRDEAGCERSNELAAAFVRDEMSDMTISKLDSRSGPVAVSRAARDVLEPAHA